MLALMSMELEHVLLLFASLKLPSGKHTKNYGKTPFLMGKSALNGNFQ